MKSFIGTESRLLPLLMHGLWLGVCLFVFSHAELGSEQSQQRLYGSQSQKYLLSGPLKKKFADSCPGEGELCSLNIFKKQKSITQTIKGCF